MAAAASREEEKDDCSCARRTHAIPPQWTDTVYKNIYIYKEESEHLASPLRPRAAISCNNGGRKQREKNAQHEAPTRIIGRHVTGEGAEEEEEKANPSIATL